MSYSQYTSLRIVRQQLGLEVKYQVLFPIVKPVALSPWLQETLGIMLGRRIAYFSEKSRSEGIVFPVLVETQRRHEFAFSLYSGAFIEADKEKGLNGECDFVLSLGEQGIELERPVFCIVEAKDNDIELGVPQCIAQMKGAQIFNGQDGNALPVIFGAVTTGDTWLFLKLEKNTLYIDNQYYYLAKTEELLGVLEAITSVYLESAAAATVS